MRASGARSGHQAFADYRSASSSLQLSLDQLPEQPVSTRLASLLGWCGKFKNLSDGRLVHAYLSTHGHDCNRFLVNCLIHMYGNCGSIEDAQSIFNKLPSRNLHSWNILIQAYAENRSVKDAQAVFDQIPEPDLYSWNTLVKAYAQDGNVQEAQALFDKIPKPDMYSWNTLFKAYAEKGNLVTARRIFDNMPQRDVVSWTAMISACRQNGHGKEGLVLFHQMQLEGVKPQKITFVSVLDACTGLSSLHQGQEVHAALIDSGYEQDVIVGTALINMYGSFSNMQDALCVFDRILHRDVVSWTAMLSACAQNGYAKESLDLFYYMQSEGIQPNKVTYVCILDACATLPSEEEGRGMHVTIAECGYEEDVVIGNALVNMYGKRGSLHDARNMFDRMPHRDVVSWSAMMALCVQHGHSQEALDTLCQMQTECVHANEITYICILNACASLSSFKKGKEIHATIVGSIYEKDIAIGNALINMYGKCGSLHNARMVFASMSNQDVISWNAMIATLAQCGRTKEALDLFHEMQLAGLKPDAITFVCVLTACSHTGQLDDGRHFFASMKRDYGVIQTVEHYACLVDLLGRAGHLDEAEDLIDNMPLETDATTWSCLLGACRIHGDVKRGVRAATQCFKLDPISVAPNIVLSHIYATAGLCDGVATQKDVLRTFV